MRNVGEVNTPFVALSESGYEGVTIASIDISDGGNASFGNDWIEVDGVTTADLFIYTDKEGDTKDITISLTGVLLESN